MSRGVKSRMRQVTFSAWGQVTFSACGQVTCTTQRHKRKQQWREERDARFLAGNTVTILSLCPLKTAILRFVVHSVLVATKCYLATKTLRQIWRNIWSRSTAVKLTEQVPPGGAKQREGGPPPPKQQKLDFGAKPVSGGELKKLVGQYVVGKCCP